MATSLPDAEPRVIARATFKTPDVYRGLDLNGVSLADSDPEQLEALIGRYVRYGETIKIEFLSDGSARVVPLS